MEWEYKIIFRRQDQVTHAYHWFDCDDQAVPDLKTLSSDAAVERMQRLAWELVTSEVYRWYLFRRPK